MICFNDNFMFIKVFEELVCFFVKDIGFVYVLDGLVYFDNGCLIVLFEG